MRVVIHIQGVEELKRRFTRLEQNVPNEIKNGINEWGQGLRDKYRYFISLHNYTKQTFNSIKWKRMTKNGRDGYISMREEGVALSESPAHYVPGMFDRRSKIRKWLLRKLGINHPIKKRFLGPGHDYYHFIGKIYLRHLVNLKVILNRRLKRGVRR